MDEKRLFLFEKIPGLFGAGQELLPRRRPWGDAREPVHYLFPGLGHLVLGGESRPEQRKHTNDQQQISELHFILKSNSVELIEKSWICGLPSRHGE